MDWGNANPIEMGKRKSTRNTPKKREEKNGWKQEKKWGTQEVGQNFEAKLGDLNGVRLTVRFRLPTEVPARRPCFLRDVYVFLKRFPTLVAKRRLKKKNMSPKKKMKNEESES